MELSVLNIEGKETGRKVTLNDQIFGIEPSDHAIYLDVKQYLANQRQGTSKSKEELKSQEVRVKSSVRKVQVQHVPVASSRLFFVAEVPFSDRVRATTVSN